MNDFKIKYKYFSVEVSLIKYKHNAYNFILQAYTNF